MGQRNKKQCRLLLPALFVLLFIPRCDIRTLLGSGVSFRKGPALVQAPRCLSPRPSLSFAPKSVWCVRGQGANWRALPARACRRLTLLFRSLPSYRPGSTLSRRFTGLDGEGMGLVRCACRYEVECAAEWAVAAGSTGIVRRTGNGPLAHPPCAPHCAPPPIAFFRCASPAAFRAAAGLAAFVSASYVDDQAVFEAAEPTPPTSCTSEWLRKVLRMYAKFKLKLRRRASGPLQQ